MIELSCHEEADITDLALGRSQTVRRDTAHDSIFTNTNVLIREQKDRVLG